MNRHQIMLATIKTYLMLAKATKSLVYRQAARKCLDKLKFELSSDKTKTMEIKV